MRARFTVHPAALVCEKRLSAFEDNLVSITLASDMEAERAGAEGL